MVLVTYLSKKNRTNKKLDEIIQGIKLKAALVSWPRYFNANVRSVMTLSLAGTSKPHRTALQLYAVPDWNCNHFRTVVHSGIGTAEIVTISRIRPQRTTAGKCDNRKLSSAYQYREKI